MDQLLPQIAGLMRIEEPTTNSLPKVGTVPVAVLPVIEEVRGIFSKGLFHPAPISRETLIEIFSEQISPVNSLSHAHVALKPLVVTTQWRYNGVMYKTREEAEAASRPPVVKESIKEPVKEERTLSEILELFSGPHPKRVILRLELEY
jgi:hypothetical protein